MPSNQKMTIMIIGAGPVGKGVAYYLSSHFHEDLTLLVVDREKQCLTEVLQLCEKQGGSQPRLQAYQADLTEIASSFQDIPKADMVISAVDWKFASNVHELTTCQGVPVVWASRPDYRDFDSLDLLAKTHKTFIAVGVGLEPGLTESVMRHAHEKLGPLKKIHLKCGGIPHKPLPPLKYKRVFGAASLPFEKRPTYQVHRGQLVSVPRFSGVEEFFWPGIGTLEAWHDGFIPWCFKKPFLKNVEELTQKTIRWPGYANFVTMLHKFGLFDETQFVKVQDREISTAAFINAALANHTKMQPDDLDKVLLQVDALATDSESTYHLQLQDTKNSKTGLTAMARVTGFTLAIFCTLMCGAQRQPEGVFTMDDLCFGESFETLLSYLQSAGVVISV